MTEGHLERGLHDERPAEEFGDNREEREAERQRELGRITVLRHGQTQYTEQYPDLTTTGEETINRSAEQIVQGLDAEHEEVAIFSSEKPRARGTADIIKRRIGYPSEVRHRPSLNPLVQRDRPRAQAVFDELVAANHDQEQADNQAGSFPAIDRAYLTDPRFEDAEVYEPRSEVERRFFRNIEYAVRAFEVVAKHPELKRPHLIGVTHYELVGQFAERIFGLVADDERTLRHGEPVEIRVFTVGAHDQPNHELVELRVTLRGQTKSVFFDRKKRDVIIPG